MRTHALWKSVSVLAARAPEAPEQRAFSDSRWIPMTWGSGSQPVFHRAHYGPSVSLTGRTHVI